MDLSIYTHMFCGVHCTEEEFDRLSSVYSAYLQTELSHGDIEATLQGWRVGRAGPVGKMGPSDSGLGSDIPAKSEPAVSASESALAIQEGGSHYKDMAIQPVEFIKANNIPFIEGNVIKYVTRHRNKNGAQDIKKAIHFLNLLLEFDYKDQK